MESKNPVVQRALSTAKKRKTTDTESSNRIVMQALEWVKNHPLPHPSKDQNRRNRTFCRRLQRKIDELRNAEQNGGEE